MLERWTLNFSQRSQQPGAQSAAPGVRLDTPAVYKRMVIALRSLFSYVRVLPAYRMVCACKVKMTSTCQQLWWLLGRVGLLDCERGWM